MKYLFSAVALVFLLNCAQSHEVLEPVNNVTAITNPSLPQYTATLNINLTAQGVNHEGKPFSALLFQSGVLVAAQYNNSAGALGIQRTGTTGGGNAGLATLILQGVNATNCPTGVDAVLANGSYDLYFGIQYAAETVTTVNTGNTGVGCGANGFIQYSSAGNLYGLKGNFVVNGNSTYSIVNTNTSQSRQHTFTLAVGTGAGLHSKNFQCFVTDPNATGISATTQFLSIYTGATNASGDASTQGAGANVHRLPVGTYKYFCVVDVGPTTPNGIFLDVGADKVATSTFTVTGLATTYLTASSFNTL